MSHDLELTDAEWQRVARLMPRDQQRGGRWRDHRQVINGILWRLRTGSPWRDIPDRYGPWQTLHKRLRRWQFDGTWARIEETIEVVVRSDMPRSDESTPTALRPTRRAPGGR